MSTSEVDDDAVRARERSVAARFLFISRSAEAAAKAVPLGRRASAYAKVMRDNGYPDLDMTEVRRLVGE